jgi:hypothetical protein
MAAEYDKDNSTTVITDKGDTIKATKYAYGQETAFIAEDGTTYLQNATTLEVSEADLDDDHVFVPTPIEGPGVIMAAQPKEDAKPKRPDPKARKAEAAKK